MQFYSFIFLHEIDLISLKNQTWKYHYYHYYYYYCYYYVLLSTLYMYMCMYHTQNDISKNEKSKKVQVMESSSYWELEENSWK